MYLGGVAAVGDRESLAVDARFEIAVHGVEEIVAVELRVEAQDRRPEQTVEQLLAPRTDAEGLGVRPGDMPEGDDGRLGQAFPDRARQQGEVVILHQHDRVLGLGFLLHGLRKSPVHGAVLLPVGGAKYGARVRDVAQRPQALVGEAIVVAGFLLPGEPDAAHAVGRILRRHHDVVAGVDHVAVGAAGAVRDPSARAGAHHRLERGHQAARRPLHLDAVVPPHVDIGLAVGHDQHLVALEVIAQDRAQRIGSPTDLRFVAHAAFGFQVLHQRLEVPRNRPQLSRLGLWRQRERLAADQRLDPGHPAAKRELRDHHGDQRDHRAQRREQIDDVFLRVGAATLDEAHVVHDQDLAQPLAVEFHRGRCEVQRTAGQLEHRSGLFRGRLRIAAGHAGGQRLRLVHERSLGVAEAEGEKPFVLQHAVEERLHALQAHLVARLVGEQLDERLLRRGGNQLRTDVEVAHKPLQRQFVHQRRHAVRNRAQRKRQRDDEAKREPHHSNDLSRTVQGFILVPSPAGRTRRP